MPSKYTKGYQDGGRHEVHCELFGGKVYEKNFHSLTSIAFMPCKEILHNNDDALRALPGILLVDKSTLYTIKTVMDCQKISIL